jgi:hypothetical protein
MPPQQFLSPHHVVANVKCRREHWRRFLKGLDFPAFETKKANDLKDQANLRVSLEIRTVLYIHDNFKLSFWYFGTKRGTEEPFWVCDNSRVVIISLRGRHRK